MVRRNVVPCGINVYQVQSSVTYDSLPDLDLEDGYSAPEFSKSHVGDPT